MRLRYNGLEFDSRYVRFLKIVPPGPEMGLPIDYPEKNKGRTVWGIKTKGLEKR